MQGSSVVARQQRCIRSWKVGRSQGCLEVAGGKDIVNRWEAARNERTNMKSYSLSAPIYI